MSELAHYLVEIQERLPHKSVGQLELMFAASRNLRRKSGLTAAAHRRLGMEKLFPSRVWHDWRIQRMEAVQYCLENRIQELMFIGSSNSNKSADMCDAAMALWYTNPEMTSVYIASPYETATETGIWTEFQYQFKEAQDANPGLPGRLKLSENAIVLNDANPKAFIRVATVDQVGKLVGKKSRDFTVGLMIIVLDELPAFTQAAARALLATIPNLQSVPNLLIMGAGNFAHTGDILGIMCDPDDRDIPGGYGGFDPDRDFRWRTKRGGLCLRFDGLQSPNVKAGHDKWIFVTTNAYIAKFHNAPGGLQSPEAMRFVRSAPITSLDEFTVTNSERINAGGCSSAFTWANTDWKKIAFVDPGFGTDPCVLQKFKFGHMALPSGGTRQVLALWERPFLIPVRVGLKDAGGTPIPVEKQIALASKKHCEENDIPMANVGFDGSLRAGIVQAFMEHYGLRVVAMDSQGAPTDRPFSASEVDKAGKPVPWNKKVDRLLSEFWFAFSSAIDSGQVKDLNLSPKAIEQLCQRRWEHVGDKKKKLQTKKDYKEMLRLQGKAPESPNEADAAVGGLELARRMGFILEGVSAGPGALSVFMDWIREKRLRGTMSMVRDMTTTALPHGTLHAMRRENSSLPSGKLHR